MLKMLRVAAMGFAAAMVASCGPAEAPKAVEAAAPEAAVTVFAAVSLTDVMKQLGEQYAAAGARQGPAGKLRSRNSNRNRRWWWRWGS